MVAGGHTIVVHDRSSAHVAAWHSPNRPQRDVGKHFKLDDSRVWMRLHFWAARESGLFANQRFRDWHIRFIAHFVRVYERTAPLFALSAARWSEDPANLRRYEAALRSGGHGMEDVVGVPLKEALRQLPPDEHPSSGSQWPYEQ